MICENATILFPSPLIAWFRNSEGKRFLNSKLVESYLGEEVSDLYPVC